MKKSIAIRNFKDNISLKFEDKKVEIKVTEVKKVDRKSVISVSTSYNTSKDVFLKLLHTSIECINSKQDKSIPVNNGSINVLYIDKYNIVISYTSDNVNDKYMCQSFTEKRLRVLIGCILYNIK